MSDGIALADRGVASVALVTEDFEPQAEFVAAAKGMTSAPRVVLPHPIAGTGSARHREIAAQFADRIVVALCGAA